MHVPNTDNLALITGFRASWKNIEPELFHVQKLYAIEKVKSKALSLSPYTSEVERDMLFQIASLSLTLRYDEIGCAN